MKRLLTAVLVLMVFNVYGQKKIVWFDTGLKAQWGASALYNKAIVDAPMADYKLGFGSAYSFGGKIGINFGYNGLAIDVMYAKASQEFDLEAFEDVSPTIDWKALDLYVLYRNTKNLGYFELGPKISFIRSVEASAGNQTAVDISENFNGKSFSAVIGFGALLMGTDGSFTGQLGLRFEYGFSDMVSSVGEENAAPLGDPSIYADGYQGSHPIFVGLVFEANWGIGYYGVAQCGGRSKFIMF